MKHPHDPALLKRIALATIQPCPPIRQSRVWVIERTGMEVSTGGACPREPYRTETRGFVYTDAISGCTYGKRYPTEHRARYRWHFFQLRRAVEFIRHLRTLPPAELAVQRRHWLKEGIPAGMAAA